MFSLRQQSVRYTQLLSGIEELNTNDGDSCGKVQKSRFSDRARKKLLGLPIQVLLGGLITVILFAGVAGFILGAHVFGKQQPGREGDAMPQVPIGLTIATFKYNESFASPPLARGSTEPVWDSLIPNGLGYVSDAPLTDHNISVIGAFHQLHCLYTLRRAFYSNSSGGEDFDFGHDRAQHVRHCFEYLRQSLMCSADPTLEPAEDARKGFLGWGFARQCKDYGELMAWADEWRAFDGRGFLAEVGQH